MTDNTNLPAQRRQVPAFAASVYRPRVHRHALVIPVINEGERIRGQLQAIATIDPRLDIVIADGGSTDGSLDAEFIATLPVRAILVKTGPGKLSAQLRMAYSWCLDEGYEGIVTIDGNGKDGVEAITDMCRKLDEGYDYVQGSRYRPGGKARNTPLERTIGNRLIHAPLLSISGRHWFSDTTNGFRAYSRRYLLDPRVAPFRDIFQRYELLFYLTVRAGQIGMKVGHVPVQRCYPTNARMPTKISGLRDKFDVLKQTFSAAFGAYHPKNIVVATEDFTPSALAAKQPHSGTILSLWTGTLFLVLSGYTAIALAPIPSTMRPIFLTVGTFVIMTFAAIHVAIQAGSRSTALLLAVGGSVLFWTLAFPAAINGTDDNAAYLIFADAFYNHFNETIQPLSERRLFSVGGSYVFQAPILHWFGISGLALVEPAFGLVLLAAVFLSNRTVSVVGAIAAIGILALLPAMGSKILANTSSTFILGALSYALIVVTLQIFVTRRPRTIDIALILTLPLAATLFRPTTAPFNGLVASGAVLLVLSTGRSGIIRLAILTMPVLTAFVAAVIPYHAIGQTFLYPLLGKGTDITGSTGVSISGSIDTTTHLINIARNIFGSPISLGVILIALFAVVSADKRIRPAFTFVMLAYLIFAALMIYATGGRASLHYVAPVSVALLLVSLTIILQAASSHIVLLDKRFPQARSIMLGGIVVGLVAMRVLGQSVVVQRLAQYTLPPSEQKNMTKIATAVQAATAKADKVLFVGIDKGRFLVKLLDRNVLIMDQPGMLSPWQPEITDYAKGLRSFLVDQHVKAIVSSRIDCSVVMPTLASGGWEGVLEFANTRNEAALCALPGKRVQLGNYVVLLENDRK